MSRIVIAGAGMMGSALAFPARENGNEVFLVGTPLDREIIEHSRATGQHPKFDRPFPAGLHYLQIEELPSVLERADLLICGVSSFGVEWFADAVLPLLPEGLPVLSVTKGLLCGSNGELTCYPEYWRTRLAKIGKSNPLCAIGGPCTSYELVAHDQSLVSFCGPEKALLERMRAWMTTSYYHVITTTDVMGIEAAVALKNGYALGIALTIGENFRRCGSENEFHYNSQAAVFLQAVREMRKLVAHLGGSEESFFVGAGDLYVTVYGGRTRKVGILLGEGFSIEEAKRRLQGVTLESLVVAGRVAEALRLQAQQGKVDLEEFPLLLHVDSIITEGAPVNIPWEKFTGTH